MNTGGNILSMNGSRSQLPDIRIGLNPEQEKRLMDGAQKMFEGARQQRSDHEADLRELSSYFLPHLCKIDNTNKTKKSNWNKIINGTCRFAVRTMQAGMQSGLTSPAKPWFNIGLEDFEMNEYTPAREYLEIATKRMQGIFRRSNFYKVATQNYGVLGSFGTAGQLQLFDQEDVFNFQPLMTGRYWIGLNAKRRVNRLFVELHLTVVQMVEMFGNKRIPPSIKMQYDRGEYFNENKVMMAIFPNPYVGWDRDGMTLLAANQKPYVSVYWMEGHSIPLKTSGYDRFPAQVPRWEVAGDEPYGIGCGMDAIGDTKAMQMKEREKAKGLMKMVNPSLSAPYEMRNALFPISGVPGGVTYRPPNTNPDGIAPLYEVNLPLQYLQQDILIDENRVNKAFYADLFLMLQQTDRGDMTAREVAERHEEKLLALSPVVENLGNEFLDPVIERSFEIMVDNDMLPPPPPEIQGKTLKVEYISPLAQAQQALGIGSIQSLLQFVGQANEMFPDSHIADKVDLDQAVDEMGISLGVPQRLIRSDDKVVVIRDNRAQQVAAAQNMEQMAMMADAVGKVGKTPAGNAAINKAIGG